MIGITNGCRRRIATLSFALVVTQLFSQPNGAQEPAELHAIGGYLVPIAARAEVYEPGFAGELGITLPFAGPQRLAARGELGVVRIMGESGASLLSGNIGLGLEYTIVRLEHADQREINLGRHAQKRRIRDSA